MQKIIERGSEKPIPNNQPQGKLIYGFTHGKLHRNEHMDYSKHGGVSQLHECVTPTL